MLRALWYPARAIYCVAQSFLVSTFPSRSWTEYRSALFQKFFISVSFSFSWACNNMLLAACRAEYIHNCSWNDNFLHLFWGRWGNYCTFSWCSEFVQAVSLCHLWLEWRSVLDHGGVRLFTEYRLVRGLLSESHWSSDVLQLIRECL